MMVESACVKANEGVQMLQGTDHAVKEGQAHAVYNAMQRQVAPLHRCFDIVNTSQ